MVFAQLNDMKLWSAWSPWEKLDPDMKRTFDGPANGVGASYRWSGNDKVGEGLMSITESQPDERVVYKLEFIKPWASVATVTIALRPEGDGVAATWSMDGTNDFMGKAMSLVMDMDKMIGKDFEQGLVNLKNTSEAAAQAKKEEEAKKAAEAAQAQAQGQQAMAAPADGSSPAAGTNTAGADNAGSNTAGSNAAGSNAAGGSNGAPVAQ